MSEVALKQTASPRQRGGVRYMSNFGPSGWWFLLPMLVLNLVVVIGPCIATVVYSLTDWPGYGPLHFTGLGNYGTLLHSNDFHQALIHNLEWTGAFLVVPVALGLLGAQAVSQVRWGQRLFRSIFFLPYIVQPVVNAALWSQIYSTHFGISALSGVSPLGDPTLSLWAVAFANIWGWWGFLAVVFLSAMQSIPRERYEAAQIDGAGSIRQFFAITLPGIRTTLGFMLIMTVIWSMLVFTYIYVMTGGGPAGSSEVIGTLLYDDAFHNQEVGLAAAMGVFLLATTGLCSAIYVIFNRRRGLDDG